MAKTAGTSWIMAAACGLAAACKLLLLRRAAVLTQRKSLLCIYTVK